MRQRRHSPKRDHAGPRRVTNDAAATSPTTLLTGTLVGTSDFDGLGSRRPSILLRAQFLGRCVPGTPGYTAANCQLQYSGAAIFPPGNRSLQFAVGSGR